MDPPAASEAEPGQPRNQGNNVAGFSGGEDWSPRICRQASFSTDFIEANRPTPDVISSNTQFIWST